MSSTILRNRVRCLVCEAVIESVTRHDYVTCLCGAVSVDGGKDYLKRNGNMENWEELSETRPGLPPVQAPDQSAVGGESLESLVAYWRRLLDARQRGKDDGDKAE